MTPTMETMQVLVVDDEPNIRRLVEKEFGNERRRITTAGTVRDARTLFKQEAFDLALLDMRLPDGSGLDLLTDFQVRGRPLSGPGGRPSPCRRWHTKHH